MRGIVAAAALVLTATVLAGCTPPKAPQAPAGSSSATAASAKPGDAVKAAEAFVKAALPDCDMNGRTDIPVNDTGQEGVSHFVYTFSYRPSYDAADTPPHKVELYQMFCAMGAYNIKYVFLLRDPDSGGDFQLLSFARPNLRDVSNEGGSAPKVDGFGSDVTLVNAKFDPKTLTISTHALWRGIGDAWDAGHWRFVDGEFDLMRFEVDPTFDDDAAPRTPASYVIYDAGH